jgi:hypothetical protein
VCCRHTAIGEVSNDCDRYCRSHKYRWKNHAFASYVPGEECLARTRSNASVRLNWIYSAMAFPNHLGRNCRCRYLLEFILGKRAGCKDSQVG